MGFSNMHVESGKADIGYWLGEAHWRKGIMSKALKSVLEFGFNRLDLNKIEARVYTQNKASAHLLEKFGFKREGLTRQSGYSNASKEIYDEYLYGLLKSEYKK